MQTEALLPELVLFRCNLSGRRSFSAVRLDPFLHTDTTQLNIVSIFSLSLFVQVAPAGLHVRAVGETIPATAATSGRLAGRTDAGPRRGRRGHHRPVGAHVRAGARHRDVVAHEARPASERLHVSRPVHYRKATVITTIITVSRISI